MVLQLTFCQICNPAKPFRSCTCFIDHKSFVWHQNHTNGGEFLLEKNGFNKKVSPDGPSQGLHDFMLGYDIYIYKRLDEMSNVLVGMMNVQF